MTRKVFHDGGWWWEDDEVPSSFRDTGTDLRIIDGVISEVTENGRIMPMSRKKGE